MKTCQASFSPRRGVFSSTVSETCGKPAPYHVGSDDLCLACARRRAKVLGLPAPMTTGEARKKAIALIGPRAFVTTGTCSHYFQSPKQTREGKPPLCTGAPAHKFPCPGGLPFYRISEKLSASSAIFQGSRTWVVGSTWEEAFEVYEKNEAADRERMKEKSPEQFQAFKKAGGVSSW